MLFTCSSVSVITLALVELSSDWRRELRSMSPKISLKAWFLTTTVLVCCPRESVAGQERTTLEAPCAHLRRTRPSPGIWRHLQHVWMRWPRSYLAISPFWREAEQQCIFNTWKPFLYHPTSRNCAFRRNILCLLLCFSLVLGCIIFFLQCMCCFILS